MFCVGSLLSFISCSGSGGTDTPIGVAPPEDGKDGRLVAFGSAAFTAASFNTGSIIIHVDLWYRLENDNHSNCPHKNRGAPWPPLLIIFHDDHNAAVYQANQGLLCLQGADSHYEQISPIVYENA